MKNFVFIIFFDEWRIFFDERKKGFTDSGVNASNF